MRRLVLGLALVVAVAAVHAQAPAQPAVEGKDGPQVVEPALPKPAKGPTSLEPEVQAPAKGPQVVEPPNEKSPQTTTPVGGGAPTATPSPPAEPEASVAAPRTEYQVGPGDVLEVSVMGSDDLSRVATVQPGGTVHLPLLGPVAVAALTTTEIARKLTALLARDYLVDPQVEVRIKEYQSQFVTVVGEVNQPARRPLRGRTRLFDILVESGGFTPRASGEVTITRRSGSFENGQTELRMRFGSANPTPADLLNLEIPLVNGDLVAALPKRYITVEGEVQRPARYPLELDYTLSQAILAAGGLTRYGKNDVRIRRTDPVSGTVSFVEADLKAIREGQSQDPALLPNDVVLVGRRTF